MRLVVPDIVEGRQMDYSWLPMPREKAGRCAGKNCRPGTRQPVLSRSGSPISHPPAAPAAGSKLSTINNQPSAINHQPCTPRARVPCGRTAAQRMVPVCSAP